MSLEAARDLSFADLLRVLSEKLDLECTKLRETTLPPKSVIESLEAKAHDILGFISSFRNTFRPVNRLPPELLSHIARDVPDHDAQDASQIIPMTCVCRYWRESLISTSEHWTKISNSSRGLMTMSLERAKSAPLEIDLNAPLAPGGRQYADLLIPHIQTTKTLKVNHISAIQFKEMFPNFPQSTPNLQSFTLLASHGVQWEWDRYTDQFESFPPTLRRLKLLGISFYPSLLELRALTELDLRDRRSKLHLDTLLDFLEENRSLESVILSLKFEYHSPDSSRRRVAIISQLQHLEIICFNAIDGRALISSIALPKGAQLVFSCCPLSGTGPTVDDVLSGISTTHLSNLLSPTFMEYRARERVIRLLGPNGPATFIGRSGTDIPFVEFPRLPLASIRRLHLNNCEWGGLLAFRHLSFLPALEMLTIEREVDLSYLLSALFSKPSRLPLLNTLAFSGCIADEEFMEEMTRFASNRKTSTSTQLHRVVILCGEGKLPSTASVRKLEEHVPIVDVRDTMEIPTDLLTE